VQQENTGPTVYTLQGTAPTCCRFYIIKALFTSRCIKFYDVTQDVSWDVGRDVWILIKKLITELAGKL
jgi:hypothetical protein